MSGRQPRVLADAREKVACPLFLLFVSAVLAGGCAEMPASFKAVQTPRPGRALNGRVAVVYNVNYRIDLGGWEKLHVFDIHKYARIYLELITHGLTRAERLIIVLYYYEQMTMKEIGATLDLSESRVSQMHSAIIARLRSELGVELKAERVVAGTDVLA